MLVKRMPSKLVNLITILLYSRGEKVKCARIVSIDEQFNSKVRKLENLLSANLIEKLSTQLSQECSMECWKWGMPKCLEDCSKICSWKL